MNNKEQRMKDLLHTQIELLIDREYATQMDKDTGYFVLVMKSDKDGVYTTAKSNVKEMALYKILIGWLIENIDNIEKVGATKKVSE